MYKSGGAVQGWSGGGLGGLSHDAYLSGCILYPSCIYPAFNCKAKLTPSMRERETTTIFIPTHTIPGSSTLTELQRNP